MRVCYFGIYKSTYTRNAIQMKGLRQNDVEVIECNSRAGGIKKYFELIKKHNLINKFIFLNGPVNK